MANNGVDVALKNAMNIDGAIAAALVDYNSGMALGATSASKELDATVAAAGNTEVVKAKMRTMEMLGLDDCRRPGVSSGEGPGNSSVLPLGMVG